MTDMVNDIIAFECGEMQDPEDQRVFFQKLIDTGMAWRLQGAYGRAAQHLIDAGVCTPTPSPDDEPWFEGFHDYEGMKSEFFKGEYDGSTESGYKIDESQIPAEFPAEDQIIFAIYSQESYEGSAVVVWRNGDGYSTTYGSHCSCYGLEGQWTTKPDVLTLSELRKELDGEGWIGEHAYSSHKGYRDKIEAILQAEGNSRAETA